MPEPLSQTNRPFLNGKRVFIVLSALAFAVCFLASEYGRARQWRWLTGWPPLLFVFTVPLEYRFRYTTTQWAREVFLTMTGVTFVGLVIASIVETLVVRNRLHTTTPMPALGTELLALVGISVLGGVLFGALSLFSAWGLFNAFYRADGPSVWSSRKRTRNEDDDSRER